MSESVNAKANTVSSANQLDVNKYVRINAAENPKMKVLFVGNSITRHSPKPDIGWFGDWGMAASAPENDYVHKTVAGLQSKFGDISCCVAQAAEWERRYFEGDKALLEFYTEARDFCADLVIIRIGENISREKNAEIPCKPYFDGMIKFFAANPKAKIILTDCFWNIPPIDQPISEIAAERDYTFCRIGDLEKDERTMAKGLFAHAGVAAHPSDYGMECIANRILACV